MEDKRIKGGIGVMIINENNQLLLGLRNPDPNTADSELHEESTWTLPGGNIEYGETFFEAGAREVKEETNLDASNLEVICVQNDMNEYSHYISVGMLCHKYSGEAKAMEPEQIIAWRWFDLDKLPPNLFSCARKTIVCYLENKVYTD